MPSPPGGRALPAALVRSGNAKIVDDVKTRKRLRQENAVALAGFASDLPVLEAQAGSCSASFRAWAGSVFGDSACGQSGLAVIDTVFPTDTYCTSGCDFQLGSLADWSDGAPAGRRALRRPHAAVPDRPNL